MNPLSDKANQCAFINLLDKDSKPMSDSHSIHSDNDQKRMRWACRRGMLELDLLLLPFFEKDYSQLSKREQKVFEILLECSDPELYAYLIGKQISNDPEQQALLDKIRCSNRCI
jgi:antitoxin CptB